MTTLRHSRELNVPANRIWEVLRDFGGVHKYHPVVSNSYLLGTANEGVGASRKCEFYDGGSIKETITEWDDGKRFKVDLTEGSMPFHRASAQMTVEAKGDRSIVGFEMDYDVKFGPLGWAMDKLMIQPKMLQMFDKVLLALETHATTGELISEAFVPAVAAAAA